MVVFLCYDRCFFMDSTPIRDCMNENIYERVAGYHPTMSACCFHGSAGALPAEDSPLSTSAPCSKCGSILPACDDCGALINKYGGKCLYCFAGIVATPAAFQKAYPEIFALDSSTNVPVPGGGIIDVKYCPDMCVVGADCTFDRDEMSYNGEKSAAKYIVQCPGSMWVRYGDHTIALFETYGEKTNFRTFSLDRLLARNNALADRISRALSRICALDADLAAEIHKQMRDSPTTNADKNLVQLYDSPQTVAGVYDGGRLTASASQHESIFRYMPIAFFTAKHFAVGGARLLLLWPPLGPLPMNTPPRLCQARSPAVEKSSCALLLPSQHDSIKMLLFGLTGISWECEVALLILPLTTSEPATHKTRFSGHQSWQTQV